MTPEDYKKYKVIMNEACDAIFRAREAQKRGDIEQWDQDSKLAADLHQAGKKLIEQSKEEGIE